MNTKYRYSLLFAFIFLLSQGCKKTDTFQSEPLSDYLQLQVGKYITYRLDSTVFVNFGTQQVINSYLAKDVIDDSITDNLGRPSWRVIRYISDTTGTQPWTPIETYMITATRQDVEVVENNLRFIKLVLPIVDGFSWKGNSYIDTKSIDPDFTYLDGWNYSYDSVGMPYSVLSGIVSNAVIVRQRDSTGNEDNIIQPPIAVAGASKTITLPTSSVSLDGSQSTAPNGFIVSYSWAQIAGPAAATLTNFNSAIATASGLQEGQYVFQLTVADNNNSIGQAQVKVIVAASGNTLPLANAGAGQSIILPVNSVTVDGTASQAPAGSITSYTWSQSSGPSVATIATPNNAVTNINNLTEGTYVFTLQIKDNTGAVSSDNVTIVVGPPVFSERDFSMEVYGKGIGLIYKNFIHTVYQPPNASVPVGSTSGYGIILNMVDHN
ncbi:MAG TPA: PKD domain-containing protein [Puia sp.]|nr:PKD domain-containing protein [Puia sp.]